MVSKKIRKVRRKSRRRLRGGTTTDSTPVTTATPDSTPSTCTTGTPPSIPATITTTTTTITGTSKSFPNGAKSISITGPATTKVGTPTVYKVSGNSGYSSWIDKDPTLSTHFIITDPKCNVTRVYSNDDTYILNAKVPGKYTVLAYMLKLGECGDETSCPVVTMVVNVTG